MLQRITSFRGAEVNVVIATPSGHTAPRKGARKAQLEPVLALASFEHDLDQ